MLRRLFLILAMFCFSPPLQAEQYIGAAPGTGGDTNPATFHFASNSVDFQMCQDDGTPLTQAEVPLVYGTDIKIFENSVDYLASHDLQAVGADLTGSNWTNPGFPALGQVAIDPATGRFKFAKNWGTADKISPALPQQMQSPSIGLDDQGGAVCGYYTNYYVGYVQNYSPQTGWSTAREMVSYGHSLKIGVGSDGFAFCVLQNNSGSPARVEAHPYYPGLGWYTGVTIDAGVAAPGQFVHLNDFAMNPSHEAFCGFAEGVSNLTLRGYVSHYSEATGWEPAVVVDDGPRRLFEVRVATCNSGTAAAVMRQYNASNVEHVYGNTYLPGGGWSGAAQLSTAAAGGEQIAISDSGYVICVFEQNDGITTRAAANVNVPGSGWQGVEYIDTATGYQVSGVAAGMNSGGQGFCVYHQHNGSFYRLYANRFIPGSGWQGAEIIDQNPNYSATAYQVAVYDNGEAVTLFKQYDGNQYRLYSNHYVPGSGWQGPVSINIGTSTSLNGFNFATRSTDLIWMAVEKQDLFEKYIYANYYASEIPSGFLRVNYSSQAVDSSAPAATQVFARVSNRKIDASNASVRIQYSILQSGRVAIRLYDLQGRLVKVVEEGYRNPGIFSLDWSGNNTEGRQVASGVYILHIQAPGINEKQKVIVIK